MGELCKKIGGIKAVKDNPFDELKKSLEDGSLFNREVADQIKLYNKLIKSMSEIGSDISLQEELKEELLKMRDSVARQESKGDEGDFNIIYNEKAAESYKNIDIGLEDILLFEMLINTPKSYLEQFKGKFVDNDSGDFPLALQEHNIHNIVSSMNSRNIINMSMTLGTAGSGKTAFVAGTAIKFHQDTHPDSKALAIAKYDIKAEDLHESLVKSGVKTGYKKGTTVKDLIENLNDVISSGIDTIVIDEITLVDGGSFDILLSKIKESGKRINLVLLGDNKQPGFHGEESTIIEGVGGHGINVNSDSSNGITIKRGYYMEQQFRSSIAPIVNVSQDLLKQLDNSDIADTSPIDMGLLRNGIIKNTADVESNKHLLVGLKATTNVLDELNNESFVKRMQDYVSAKSEEDSNFVVTVAIGNIDGATDSLFVKELGNLSNVDITIVSELKELQGIEKDFIFFKATDGDFLNDKRYNLSLLNMLITRSRLFNLFEVSPNFVKYENTDQSDGLFEKVSNDIMVRIAEDARVSYKEAFSDIDGIVEKESSNKFQEPIKDVYSSKFTEEVQEKVSVEIEKIKDILKSSVGENGKVNNAHDVILNINDSISTLKSDPDAAFLFEVRFGKELNQSAAFVLNGSSIDENGNYIITNIQRKTGFASSKNVYQAIKKYIEDVAQVNSALNQLNDNKNITDNLSILEQFASKYKGVPNLFVDGIIDFLNAKKDSTQEAQSEEEQEAKVEETKEETAIDPDIPVNEDKEPNEDDIIEDNEVLNNPEIINELESEKEADDQKKVKNDFKEAPLTEENKITEDEEFKSFDMSESELKGAKEAAKTLREEKGLIASYPHSKNIEKHYLNDKKVLEKLFKSEIEKGIVKLGEPYSDKTHFEHKVNSNYQDFFLIKQDGKIVLIAQDVFKKWHVVSYFSNKVPSIKSFLEDANTEENRLYKVNITKDDLGTSAGMIVKSDTKMDLDKFIEENKDKFIFSDPFFIANGSKEIRYNGAPIVLYAPKGTGITKADLNKARYNAKDNLSNKSSNGMFHKGNRNIGLLRLDVKPKTLTDIFENFVSFDADKDIDKVVRLRKLLAYKDRGFRFLSFMATLHNLVVENGDGDFNKADNQVVSEILKRASYLNDNPKKGKKSNLDFFGNSIEDLKKLISGLSDSELNLLRNILSSSFPSGDTFKINKTESGDVSSISSKSMGFYIENPDSLLAKEGIEKSPYRGSLMKMDLITLMKKIDKMDVDSETVLGVLDKIMLSTQNLKYGLFVTFPRTKANFGGTDHTTTFGNVDMDAVEIDLLGLKDPAFIIRESKLENPRLLSVEETNNLLNNSLSLQNTKAQQQKSSENEHANNALNEAKKAKGEVIPEIVVVKKSGRKKQKIKIKPIINNKAEQNNSKPVINSPKNTESEAFNKEMDSLVSNVSEDLVNLDIPNLQEIVEGIFDDIESGTADYNISEGDIKAVIKNSIEENVKVNGLIDKKYFDCN